MFSVANILTGLNLYCGSLAILYVSMNKVSNALLLFLLCLIFDFLDGLVARALREESELGIQLDSLADVVSFGVLPSMMMYKILDQNLEWNNLKYSSFVLVVMAGFRLARFNIEADGKVKNFQGLPVPAMAIFIVGLYSDSLLRSMTIEWLYHPYIIVLIIITCSLLMISRIPILKITFSRNVFKEHFLLWVLLLICIIMLTLGNFIFASVFIVIHILYSIIKLSQLKNL